MRSAVKWKSPGAGSIASFHLPIRQQVADLPMIQTYVSLTIGELIHNQGEDHYERITKTSPKSYKPETVTFEDGYVYR
jgi:hypothetical protein